VWNSKVVVAILPVCTMHMHGSQEEDFWAEKGKQTVSQMRTKSLCRSGRGREFAGEALPHGAQWKSSGRV
jgi:hypothetical protein